VPLESISFENTNGFDRPIVFDQNKKVTYEAIKSCFNQIGIKTTWNGNSNFLPPGEFEIYIPAKIE
jgi:hypothetical protein